MLFTVSAGAADSGEELQALGDLSIEQLMKVVVTGLRGSVQAAQEIKQNAEVIVDSVTAMDIGALPDRSVTEALQRIPGVTINHLFLPNDTNRFSAEGSGVAVRGLTQVRSELNGRDVFSARNNRGLSFEDVPSELMTGVDVYKNPSADLLEGGLGGTINLRTRKPFDAKGLLAGITVGANYGDFSKATQPQASFLISNRWNTDSGEFGAMIDVAYSKLTTRTDGIQYGRPTRREVVDTLNGITLADTSKYPTYVYIPQGVRWSELDFERKRQGFTAVLQWRPNDRTELTLDVTQSDYQMDWTENSAWFQDWAYNVVPAAGTAFSYDADGVFQSGVLSSNAGSLFQGSTRRAAALHQKTTSHSFNIKVDATERLSLSGDVQYVNATAANHDYTVNTESQPPSIALNVTGDLPAVSISGDYSANPANYFWAAAMDDRQENRGSELAARMDLDYVINTGWLKSIKAGIRFTDRDAINKDTGYNWAPITERWNGSSSLSYLNNVLPGQSSFFNFNNFYRGNASLPAGVWIANEALVKNLIANASTIQSASNGGWVWSPASYQPQNTHTQGEQTYSAFGLLRFGTDLGLLPVDGNVGVRIVHTATTTTGYSQLNAVAGNVQNLPSSLIAYSSGGYFPASLHGSYNDVLPSLNLRVKIAPELQWRFAAAKAINRPTFDQLRAAGSLSIDANSSGVITGYSGSGGNPRLRPMRANQFDTALEWYFAPQGSLTGTLFYKDVQDYFISGAATENIFNQDWLVTTTVNGDHGTLKGFELAYSQFYDFLPGWLRGLGAQANFTYVDSAGSPGPTGSNAPPGLPLEGLSRTSYNVVALYQRGPLEVRLAYNWRERWLLTSNDGDGKGTTWNDDYGQLDGSIFFRINSHVQVGVEANNLTNTTQKLLIGPYQYSDAYPEYNYNYVDSHLYQNAWFTFDRRYAATVKVTF